MRRVWGAILALLRRDILADTPEGRDRMEALVRSTFRP